MTPTLGTVPGPEYESGYETLVALTATATELRAAVAFVTSSGVDLLETLLSDRPGLELRLTARGAPITEPAALIRLTALGADVSLVTGEAARRFHPKLWLARGESRLHVLSGSGNLTDGGLLSNDEQFEYLRLEASDAALIDQHERRFEGLIRHAVPIGQLRDTPFWSEWEKQEAERRKLAERAAQLDLELARNAGAELAKDRLYEDLVELFERTKAEVRIPDGKGGEKPYVATRFKQSIDRGHRTGLIVPAVAAIVRKPTEGFNHLAEAERPELMVETLVLDAAKPYHRLFTEKTKTQARANLDTYRPRSA